MRIYLYRLAAWLAPKLPLGLEYWLAVLAGDLLWFFAEGTRAKIEHNQRRALGPGATPEQVSQSSRQALRNLAKIYVDEFRLPALSHEALREQITIHGLEHLQAAHAAGQGVIVTSAHYGAPQVVGQMLAVLGYPTTVAVEHLQPEEVFQFMCNLRTSHGLRLIPVDQPLMPLVRTLRKERGIVGLAVDRNVTGSGVCLPFLGEETRIPDGPVRLALRTGATLLLALCRRVPENRYEAVVLPPIELPDTLEDMEAAVREGTARLIACLEPFIRERPEQWILTVPLWKSGCGEED